MQHSTKSGAPAKRSRRAGRLQKDRWSGWTEWTPLGELALSRFKAVPEEFGAYAVSVGRRLHRANGIDEDGLLDVGESRWLRWRVKQLWRCIENPKAACTVQDYPPNRI